MSYFILQSVAMLLAAYLVGCMLGCFARRLRGLEEVPIAAAAGALPGEPLVARSSARVAHDLESDVVVRKRAPEPPPAEQDRFARALGPSEAPPAAGPPRREPAKPTPVPPAPAVSAQPAPAPAAARGPTDSAPPQDLKRIKGIGPEYERRLMALGVSRYAHIAAWTAADVMRFSRELDLHGRIQHDNWIEQAQILARGSDTAFSRRVDRREVPSGSGQNWVAVAPQQVERQGGVSAGGAGEAASGAAPAVFPAAASAGGAVAGSVGADDLKRIRGISAEIESALGRAGVARYAEIARWSPADIARVSTVLGLHGRIERETWVEQARVLARGVETEFARRLRLQEEAVGVPAETPRPSVPESARPAAPRATRSAGPDDLKRIRGINLVIERKLARMGVTGYEQIASWSTADIERISESLGVKGNIERERWIEQAQILSGGGSTDFSTRLDRGVVSSSREEEGKG